MEIYDVVVKLVGQIKPVGETNEDNRRFENLKVMTELIDLLICDIEGVASQKNRQEYSIGHAGKFADNYLKELGIEE